MSLLDRTARAILRDAETAPISCISSPGPAAHGLSLSANAVSLQSMPSRRGNGGGSYAVGAASLTARSTFSGASPPSSYQAEGSTTKSRQRRTVGRDHTAVRPSSSPGLKHTGQVVAAVGSPAGRLWTEYTDSLPVLVPSKSAVAQEHTHLSSKHSPTAQASTARFSSSATSIMMPPVIVAESPSRVIVELPVQQLITQAPLEALHAQLHDALHM